MARQTLEDIFAEKDEFGLLDVKARSVRHGSEEDKGLAVLREVSTFFEKLGRLPDTNSDDHDEMRLATIWEAVRKAPTEAMNAADIHGLMAQGAKPVRSWRDEPEAADIPESLDDIFDDDELSVDPSLSTLTHTTPAAGRHLPDHRAEFVPCRDFDLYREKIEAVQKALEAGEREATPVKKWAVIEPLEGDFFIRNGLLAMIAEKSEMTARGGSRDHRLRVIFSNGMESDPLMSSFRKSLNEDKTARLVQKIGFGPLDPDWETDRLDLSGTIYVARSCSEDPAIKQKRMILHKIGVTGQDVQRRVADARNDPTFLLAPVEIVATYELKNLSRRKVESLLHRFFEPARPAELFVTDRFGKRVHPREWFYVLPEQVGKAAKLIEEGALHKFRYVPEKQTIEEK